METGHIKYVVGTNFASDGGWEWREVPHPENIALPYGGLKCRKAYAPISSTVSARCPTSQWVDLMGCKIK